MELDVFMKGNCTGEEITEYEASARYKDKKGASVKWKLKAIPMALDKDIKRKCISNNYFDQLKYLEMLVVNSIIFPDLKNADLQDSYGVRGESALLEKLLLGGEYNKLAIKVQEINGLLDMNQLITQAKNA